MAVKRIAEVVACKELGRLRLSLPIFCRHFTLKALCMHTVCVFNGYDEHLPPTTAQRNTAVIRIPIGSGK